MKIGPFSPTDLESVQELFAFKNVEHHLVASEEGLEALRNPQHPGGRKFGYRPSPFFFEISDTDFAKVKAELENYGIVVTESDGSWELSDQE